MFAVTSLKRSGAAPDLPTMAESGYPGFAALIRAEIPQWAKVIKEAGIKATD